MLRGLARCQLGEQSELQRIRMNPKGCRNFSVAEIRRDFSFNSMNDAAAVVVHSIRAKIRHGVAEQHSKGFGVGFSPPAAKLWQDGETVRYLEEDMSGRVE